MALYFYQAFSRDGKKVSGQIDAQSVATAKDQLSKQGLFPITITLGVPEGKQSFLTRFFSRKVSSKDVILFTQQLSTLLRAGVPLLQALELLSDHFTGALRNTLIAIKDDIKEGRSFYDALRKYPRTFDTIYVQLVRAGEASGNLEVILDRLTTYMERREELASRVRKAMLYPMIQLALAFVVVVGLMVFVVPSMLSIFAGEGKDLPTITAIVVAISDFLVNYWLYLIIFFIALISGVRYWMSTPSGRRKMDQLKLRLPFISYFTRTNAVVQFSYTLGILEESRVNLAESLDIVVKIIDNQILADALNAARDKIIKQGKIAQYLKQTNLFPPIAIYLIQTGEESGKLDEMLLTVASNYERELKDLTDTLSSLLSIILLLVVAVVVGFVVLAMVMPIIEFMQTVGV